MRVTHLAPLLLVPLRVDAAEPRLDRAPPREVHPAPEAPDPIESPEDRAARAKLVFRVGAAGAIRTIVDIPTYGAGLALGISTGKRTSPGLVARAAWGRTQAGLSTFEGMLGGTFELQSDPLRFHAGSGIYVLTLERATTRTNAVALAPGGIIGMGVDIGQPAHVFVLADFEAMVYLGGGKLTAPWGPTLTVGYRF